jgi:hypothetical protein
VPFVSVQFWQVWPPMPQSLSCVPTAQTSPTQQPFAQFVELQSGDFGTHCWFVHTSLSAAQFVHWLPFTPHCMSLVPTKHVLPWQQPGQFVASQFGSKMHTPPPVGPCGAHSTFGPEQLKHWLPPLPHASGSMPGMHWPLAQQPDGQLLGPHVEVVHAPPTPASDGKMHCPPVWVQSWQKFPSAPHAMFEEPIWQLPNMSQQPEHVIGPHDCGGMHTPPAPGCAWHCSPIAAQLVH